MKKILTPKRGTKSGETTGQMPSPDTAQSKQNTDIPASSMGMPPAGVTQGAQGADIFSPSMEMPSAGIAQGAQRSDTLPSTMEMPTAGIAQGEQRIDILPPKTAMLAEGLAQGAQKIELLPTKQTMNMNAGAGPYVPMVFHGGPVITAPELVAFYWGAFQQSEIASMQTYLRGFASFLNGEGSPLRQECVVNQYGTVGGVVGASYHIATAPAQATDADVHNQVTTLQAQGHLPAFGPERLFLVFTKGITFQDYGSVWCAYHGAWGSGQYYAICPYPSAGGCGQNQPMQSWQSVTSHEILEAVTDPSVGGGWTQGNEEGGDTCAWQELAVSFGTVQLFADNRQQACSAWTAEVGKISVVSWGPERLDIFVIGTDAALYHKYWSPSTGWGPSITLPHLQGPKPFDHRCD